MSDTTATEDHLMTLIMEPGEGDEPEAVESDADAPEPEALEAEGDDAPETPEDDGEEAPDEETEEPQTITVRVDGEEVAVTLDELRRGYSGQAKIQKGLQEVAEVRKVIEAEAMTLQQQREAILSLAQEMQATGVLSAPVAPDPALADRDPVGYVRANAKYQAELAEYLSQKRQFEQLTAQQRAAEAAQEARMREDGIKELVTLIPDLADEAKAPQVQRMLLKAGEKHGYTAEEIGSVMDPRALHILYKAARYDALQGELQGARQAVEAKVAKARPTLRPNATLKTAPDSVKLTERMKRAPTEENFVNWLTNPR